MARPFEEPSHPAMSSIASQTSLGGPSEEYGQSWTSKRGYKERKARPRLPKIKSSPSNGALAVARADHQRNTHKRVNSASATPTSPTFVPDYLLQSTSPHIPASAHAGQYSPVEAGSKAKSRVTIKPLLRKFSSQEKVAIDLSRSASENQGIGLYESSQPTASIRTDSGSTRRAYHHREISGTSQISTTSSRYNSHYVHPMRQTPLPYTPPIAGSYKTSLESDTPVPSLLTDDTTSTPYAPLPTITRRNITAPPPLHIRTGSSFTNSSQTNLPGTPSSLRFPTTSPHNDADTMISPATGRSSLESAFARRNRSRSNTAQTDPVQQAATVQHLRQKFQEKEAAKDRKYQEADFRAKEKEQRRRERREEDERRTSEKRERKGVARSRAASEKSSLVGGGGVGFMVPPAEMALALRGRRWHTRVDKAIDSSSSSTDRDIRQRYMEVSRGARRGRRRNIARGRCFGSGSRRCG